MIINQKKIKVASPLIDFREINAVKKVLLSGNYSSGKNVKKFESKFAQYIGTKYACACSNGTSALFLPLNAFNIKEGDEVIVPPLSFFSTITAVISTGATPIFSEIDSDDLCISPTSFKKIITKKTKAIIVVHLYGCPAKMKEINKIAKKNNIKVIEDCAQAHGSMINKKKVGSFGHAGSFSFYATKHMTTGEGGMIVSDNKKFIDKCKKLRNHGLVNNNTHKFLGYNNRMNEIEASMGLIQLNKLERFNNLRIKNSNYIIRKLSNIDFLRVVKPNNYKLTHTYFWLPFFINPKIKYGVKKFLKYLKKNKIEFRQRYKEPLYKQPILKTLGFKIKNYNYPIAEKYSGSIIGLPNHPKLKITDLNYLIKKIKDYQYYLNNK